jgi:hypothetical protein
MQNEYRLSHTDGNLRQCAGCGALTGAVWAHLWSDRRRSGYTEYHVCGEACARAVAQAAPSLATRPLTLLTLGANA